MCGYCSLQRRTDTSIHGSLHSRRPIRLRLHSIPRPVHSDDRGWILLLAASAAAPSSALAVSCAADARKTAVSVSASVVGIPPAPVSPGLGHDDEGSSMTTPAPPGASGEDMRRGSNQLLCRSKKQWSDQWHDEMNSTKRSTEQYMHGRFRKYVDMKKRTMNAGDALVGMNSRGSQLLIVSHSARVYFRDEDESGQGCP